MGKFIRRGISKAYFLPDVAGASPTRAEINAGVPLGQYLTAMTGFSYTGSRVPAPVLENRFTLQEPGEDTVADSSLTFFDDDDVEEIRDALAKGTEGHVFLEPYGDVAGKRAELWPGTSMGVTDAWDIAGNTLAQYTVPWAVTGVPNLECVIPAP